MVLRVVGGWSEEKPNTKNGLGNPWERCSELRIPRIDWTKLTKHIESLSRKQLGTIYIYIHHHTPNVCLIYMLENIFIYMLSIWLVLTI